uniref:Uncharacterized protein n=1 Tax=Leptospirillum sp. Group II '5-way CG' TaxID=419541 RepID=B6AS89_9BACT|nr:MAG: Conserved hypothetical protein [Leptospirillum sp. Group II '5-way CG']
MPTLSESRPKIMTGNAIRQARYAEKMRSWGRKKLTLWVTPEEEKLLRDFLATVRRDTGME